MPSSLLEAVAGLRRMRQEKEFRKVEAKFTLAKKTVPKKATKKAAQRKPKKSAVQLEQERLKKEKMRLKAFKKRQAGLPKQKLHGIKTESGLTIVREKR